jgi:NAD(P)-dependent dehydrogenase (short-subunit alcohol dehydrogenase family)
MARSSTKRGARPNEGLRVLVTAGAAGIGRTIAQAMTDAGARVHVCDVSEQALKALRRKKTGLTATLADVASEEDVDRLFTDVRKELRGLDVLVNNAGIAGPTGPVETLSPADWRRTIEVDLIGQFLCARLAVPMLKKSRNASMINISSVAGRLGYAYRTPYAAAKWGVIGFTQSLAKELGPAGIRVNAILPGLVAGERIERVIAARAETLKRSYKEVEREHLEKVSLRRMVSAEDVANTIVFLCSPLGRSISGQSISVCGNVETI